MDNLNYRPRSRYDNLRDVNPNKHLFRMSLIAITMLLASFVYMAVTYSQGQDLNGEFYTMDLNPAIKNFDANINSRVYYTDMRMIGMTEDCSSIASGDYVELTNLGTADGTVHGCYV